MRLISARYNGVAVRGLKSVDNVDTRIGRFSLNASGVLCFFFFRLSFGLRMRRYVTLP